MCTSQGAEAGSQAIRKEVGWRFKVSSQHECWDLVLANACTLHCLCIFVNFAIQIHAGIGWVGGGVARAEGKGSWTACVWERDFLAEHLCLGARLDGGAREKSVQERFRERVLFSRRL